MIGLLISALVVAYYQRDNEPLSVRDAYELTGVILAANTMNSYDIVAIGAALKSVV